MRGSSSRKVGLSMELLCRALPTTPRQVLQNQTAWSSDGRNRSRPRLDGTVPVMGTADDAHTWDELVDQDQLLPGHIQVLYGIEAALKQQSGLTDEQRRLEMLKRAREFAKFKTSGQVFSDVPFPPEAGRVSTFDYDEINDVWRRAYEGRESKIGRASIQISGSQGSDGAVLDRNLAIRIEGLLTAEEGRQFASLLIAEADEIERLNAAG
jgi:hypothetical protein